jgi:hypothetical protein
MVLRIFDLYPPQGLLAEITLATVLRKNPDGQANPTFMAAASGVDAASGGSIGGKRFGSNESPRHPEVQLVFCHGDGDRKIML